MILGSIILIVNIVLKATGNNNAQEDKFFIAGLVFNLVMILSGVMGIMYWKTRKAWLFWSFIALLGLNLVYRILGLVHSIV